MGKYDVAVCEQGGISKDIQNDEYPGVCTINQKRVDSVWGESEVVTVLDTPEEWKQLRKPLLSIEQAHGGKLTGSQDVEIVSWIKWVKTKRPWAKAKAFCESMNGVLFSDLDGTKAQLDFFSEKMDEQSHWLGVYEKSRNVWYDIKGNLMQEKELYWGFEEPSANGGGVVFNRITPKGARKFLHDRKDDVENYFFCDMLNV